MFSCEFCEISKNTFFIEHLLATASTYRAWKYDIPEARKWGDKKYPEYKFKRETDRDWKFKYEKYCKENVAVSANSSQSLFTMPQRGKPALISEELSTEIKKTLSNLRVAGCSISGKVVISMGNGVLASRCPEKNVKEWWKNQSYC